MGELRKDYILDRYVIISPERGKRPHDFTKPATEVKQTPFTPGNEQVLPGILYEEPKGAAWRYRIVPNKFAIARPQGQQQMSTDRIYTFAANFGEHNVVVEGQQDGIPFVDLGPEGISGAIRVAIAHGKELASHPAANEIIYFKNEGPDAGASINHPHSQILSLSVCPPEWQAEAALHATLRAKQGRSPLLGVLEQERSSNRFVTQSQHFAVLCPYASAAPLEALIIPLRDHHTYLEMTDEEREDLAHQLHRLLSKIKPLNLHYNVVWIHTLRPSGMHWHIRLMPRGTPWAGFEYATGIIVNAMPPEDAAAFYRS